MEFSDKDLAELRSRCKETKTHIQIPKEDFAKIELALSILNTITNDEVTIPNLANATPSFLADELGELRQRSKAIERYEGVIKQALTARKEEGRTSVRGEKWNQEFVPSAQTRLDTEAIRKDMDEDWLKSHSKTITFITIKSSRLT